MRSTIYYNLILLLLIGQASAYTLDKNSVYIDNSNLFLNVTPHTADGGGLIYYDFTPKTYSGDLDMVWGFDTNITQPRYLQVYAPYQVNTSHTFTCDCQPYYDDIDNIQFTACHFNYTLNPKTAVCWRNMTWKGETQILRLYDGPFHNGSIPTKTITYITTKTHDYQQLTPDGHVDWNHGGMNKWFYKKNLGVTAGNKYTLRLKLDIDPSKTGKHKYWTCVKPSSKTLQEAKDDGHLYCMDPWYDVDFPYRWNITVNNSMATALTNYTALVKLTAATFNYNRCNETGLDLRFYDHDNSVLLDYDRDEYDNTGDSFIWVRIPSLAATTVRTISMYCGNWDAADGEDTNAVYDDEYDIVTHAGESSGDLIDSTANGNIVELHNSPTMASSGLVGGAIEFDKATDWGNYSTFTNPAYNDLTITYGFRLGKIVQRGNYFTSWYTNSVLQHRIAATGNRLHYGFKTSNAVESDGAITTLQENRWYWNAIRYNHSVVEHWVNMSVDMVLNPNDDATPQNNRWWYGWGTPGGTYNWNGSMDEIRIYNGYLSNDYLNLMHRMMFDDEVISLGSEEGIEAPTVVLSDPADNDDAVLNQIVEFNSTGTSVGVSMENATLWLWDSTPSLYMINYTASVTSGSELSLDLNIDKLDDYLWNMYYCDEANQCETAAANHTLYATTTTTTTITTTTATTTTTTTLESSVFQPLIWQDTDGTPTILVNISVADNYEGQLHTEMYPSETTTATSGVIILDDYAAYRNVNYWLTAWNNDSEIIADKIRTRIWSDVWWSDHNITGNYIVGDNVGINDDTSYWLCTANDCSSTCQVEISGGIITGCT
jgi:hypothetical protein